MQMPVSGILQKLRMTSQHCTDAVERPGRTHTVHQRFDDGRHGIGLRSGQLSAGETVCLVEDNPYSTYGSGRNDGSEDLPGLLLGRRAIQPVTDLQVCDEASRLGPCRAYYSGHHRVSACFPSGPFSPTDVMTTDARINVLGVDSDTGFVPAFAMALAAPCCEPAQRYLLSAR